MKNEGIVNEKICETNNGTGNLFICPLIPGTCEPSPVKAQSRCIADNYTTDKQTKKKMAFFFWEGKNDELTIKSFWPYDFCMQLSSIMKIAWLQSCGWKSPNVSVLGLKGSSSSPLSLGVHSLMVFTSHYKAPWTVWIALLWINLNWIPTYSLAVFTSLVKNHGAISPLKAALLYLWFTYSTGTSSHYE